MAFTFPTFRSLLSQYFTPNNFIALQSAKLAVTDVSGSISFSDFATSGRITLVITNTGTNGCYLSSGTSSATAVTSTTSPLPSTGSVSTCHYLAPGSVQTLDFVSGTYTFAAICASGLTTTLEISIGYGQ